MSIIIKIGIALALFTVVNGCGFSDKENEQKLMRKVISRFNDDGAIFGNNFLHWDEVYRETMVNVFYEDSIVLHLGLKKKKHLIPDLVKINFDNVRRSMHHPGDGTLLEIAPDLDSLELAHGSQFDVITNYLNRDRKKSGRHCFYYFTKPVFTENGFAFIYIDTFCGREQGSGELYGYKFIDNNWEEVIYYMFYVS